MSDPTAFMRRREVAAYLKDRGIPCNYGHLRRLAQKGGGPKFIYYGDGEKPRVLYRLDWLNEWLASKLSEVRTSTCDPGTPLGP